MYTQFFGNYLLQKELVTLDQLMHALSRLSDTKLKLGTIAMHKGLMTAGEVDECLYLQTTEDKRFGEIAVERGYLTDDQVRHLLDEQVDDYLLLGQTLVEDQVFTNDEFERIIFDYQADNEVFDLEDAVDTKDQVQALIRRFMLVSDADDNSLTVMYLELLFNSLIRFIGDDFTIMTPMTVTEFPVTYGVTQKIIGSREYNTYISVDREQGIEFASRYAKEQFTDFDEYVFAAMEDFVNLHNGLFLVNASNQYNEEMSLFPPSTLERTAVDVSEDNCVIFPVLYPFGVVHLIVTF